jgi:hypothetical protein
MHSRKPTGASMCHRYTMLAEREIVIEREREEEK